MKREDFIELVNEGLAAIDQKFLRLLDNVSIVVEDWPTNEQLTKAHLKDPKTLLGLYEGVPQTERRHYSAVLPDKITIFQKPIELIGSNDYLKIKELVKETVWHELAHHFGLDEKRVRKAVLKRKIKNKL